jgi:hypothetical protein
MSPFVYLQFLVLYFWPLRCRLFICSLTLLVRLSEIFEYFIIRKTYSSFRLTLFGSRAWLPREDVLRGVVREFRFQKGEIFL